MRVPNVSAPNVSIPTDNGGLRHDIRLGTPMQQQAGQEAFSGQAKNAAMIREGLSALATAGMKISKQMQDERDDATARDAMISFNDDLTAELYGDNNSGKVGVFGRKGKDALDSVPAMKSWIDKRIQSVTGKMSRGAAERFSKQATGLRFSTMAGVARHEASERNTWQIQALTTEIDVEGRMAANSYHDHRQYNAAIERLSASVYQRAQRLGLPEETAREQISAARSAALAGVFGRLVEAKSWESARDLFDDPRFSEEDKRKVAGIYHKARLDDEYANARKDPEGTKKRILAELGRVFEVKPVSLPAEVSTLAASEAERQGVDPALVAAVIHQESRGRDGQVSKAGARGLMQLMPGTQKELEQRYGISGDTPEGNIALGTAYLKELLDRYGGDQKLALMAYNGGMDNVDHWLKTGRWKKNNGVIPKETREYVSTILGQEIPDGKNQGPGVPGAVLLAESDNSTSGVGAEQPKQPSHLLDMSETDKFKVLTVAETLVSHQKQQEAKAKIEAAKENADAMYGQISGVISHLPLDEQEFLATKLISDIEDRETRERVEKQFRADHTLAVTKEKAQDNVLSRKFREYVKEQGLTPSKALEFLPQIQNISDKGRSALEKEYLGEGRKETPQNRAALDAIRSGVDRQEVLDETTLEALAFDYGLTDSQTQKALRYLQDGGNVGQLRMERVNSILKAMNKGKGLDRMTGFYDALEKSLEPGKPLTDPILRKTIANLLVDGEREGGGGWFSWGHGADMPYAEAVKNDVGGGWLPDLTEEQEKDIRKKYQARGIQNPTPEELRLYKKHSPEYMGLPRVNK